MKRLTLVAAALVFIGGLSCTALEPADPIDGPPTLSGPVLDVANQGQRLLIQSHPPDRSSGTAWIEVVDETVLYEHGGKRLGAGSIRPGDVLSVWTTYPVLRSDPAQATAQAIVVDPGTP